MKNLLYILCVGVIVLCASCSSEKEDLPVINPEKQFVQDCNYDRIIMGVLTITDYGENEEGSWVNYECQPPLNRTCFYVNNDGAHTPLPDPEVNSSSNSSLTFNADNVDIEKSGNMDFSIDSEGDLLNFDFISYDQNSSVIWDGITGEGTIIGDLADELMDEIL